MNFETENTEFKSVITDEIYKEVIAFANTNGGVIYAGIDNAGNVIGLSDIDNEYTRLTNGIRDSILPDVTMFVKYTVREDKVIAIEISEGANKPYYLRSKGLKSSGVYVRQGTSSVPASQDMIRLMIKLSDGDNYEEMRSTEQNLTFDAAHSAFKKYNVEFSTDKYRNLGLTQTGSNMFTNLAQIISDQCSHTTKIAVFSDSEKTLFVDSKEFKGSAFSQLEEAYSYLMLCNKKTSEIEGLERKDKPDYPQAAVREALLNAIVHRDYSYSGSIIINVNDSETEFISIGGLLPGLSTEDILSGISQPRNKNLAEIFHRLNLIESYGTGIRRIFNLYSECPVSPRIEVTQNTFKLILPNINKSVNTSDLPLRKTENPQINAVLEYIHNNGSITYEEVEKILNIKRTRSYVIIKSMSDLGLITCSGRGAQRKFFIK